MGHGKARQWGGTSEDGAQLCKLLRVQGSAGIDKVDRVNAREAGEESRTELLHCSHVVGRKLTDGL